MGVKKLIGITGVAQAGKDTVAEHLEDKYHLFRYSLASPIKRAAMVLIPHSSTGMGKEELIPDLGVSWRHVWQTLGTEWGRNLIHPQLWVLHMLRAWRHVLSSDEWDGMVVSDVRFDNEAKAIRAQGGEVWRVARPGLDMDEGFRAHVSEHGVESLLISRDLTNDSTIDHLHAQVDSAFVDTSFGV